MLESYILLNVLSVLFQLPYMYLDELYRECNGTARACANSGYQVLFSPIAEHLGMRLVLWMHAKVTSNRHHSMFITLLVGEKLCRVILHSW